MVKPNATPEAFLQAIRRELDDSTATFVNEPTVLTGGFWAQMLRFSLVGQTTPDGELVGRIMPDPEVGARETVVQRHLAEAGFPTPRVLVSGDPTADFDWAWSVMTYAKGQPLLDDLSALMAVRRAPGLALNLPKTLARTAVELHQTPTDALAAELGVEGSEVESMAAGLVAMADALDRPDFRAAARTLQQSVPATTLDAEPVLCHGDLHPFNLLLDGDQVTVLDWSSARLAPREYDLAYTLMLLEHPPLATPDAVQPAVVAAGRFLARRFRKSYDDHGAAPVDEGSLRWFTAFHAARCLTEITMWHDDGRSISDHPFSIMRRHTIDLVRDASGIALTVPEG